MEPRLRDNTMTRAIVNFYSCCSNHPDQTQTRSEGALRSKASGKFVFIKISNIILYIYIIYKYIDIFLDVRFFFRYHVPVIHCDLNETG